MIPPRWTVLKIAYECLEVGLKVTAVTDVPAHLFLRWTTVEPQIHKDYMIKRGLRTMAGYRFRFVTFEDNEQEEVEKISKGGLIKETDTL